jgi:hypothetical protein
VSETPEPTVSLRKRWIAPAILATLVSALLGTTWQTEGTLATQRMVIDLAMPVGVAWLAALYVSLRMFILGRRSASAMAAFVGR